MKSLDEMNNIVDSCLQVINEHQCHPLESYAVIESLRYSVDVTLARMQSTTDGDKTAKLLGVADRVDKMMAEGKAKTKVKVE